VEALIHLDTHVVAWLWAGDRARLRPVARRLEQAELFISPMVVLELQYLFEIGRTTTPGEAVVADLVGRIGLRVATTPFPRVIARAASLGWTRDPFDRIIVAQAAEEGAPLLTRDRAIRKHFAGAIWAPRRTR